MKRHCMFVAMGATVLSLGLTGLASAEGPTKAPSPGAGEGITAPREPAIPFDQKTKQQLDQAPDKAMITIEGHQIPVGEIRAKIQEARRKALAEAVALGAPGPRIPKAHAALTRTRWEAMLREENAKVKSAVALRRQQGAALPQGAQLQGSQRGALSAPASKASPPTKGAQVQGAKPGAVQTTGPLGHIKDLGEPRGTGSAGPAGVAGSAGPAAVPGAQPQGSAKATTTLSTGQLNTVAQAVREACRAQPAVTKVEGAVTPRGEVIVRGCGFGDPSDPGNQNQIRLLGQFPNGVLTLTPTFWSDDMVSGIIPDVTGVLDQQARIQVVSKFGAYSPEHRVKFTAMRGDAILLPAAATQAHCDRDPNPSRNNCNGAGDSISGFDCGGTTFCGIHVNFNTTYEGRGIDGFKVTLKNGWELESMGYLVRHSTGVWGVSSDIEDPYKQFMESPADSLDLALGWYNSRAVEETRLGPLPPEFTTYGYFPWVSYKLWINIVGPVGTSYK